MRLCYSLKHPSKQNEYSIPKNETIVNWTRHLGHNKLKIEYICLTKSNYVIVWLNKVNYFSKTRNNVSKNSRLESLHIKVMYFAELWRVFADVGSIFCWDPWKFLKKTLITVSFVFLEGLHIKILFFQNFGEYPWIFHSF